MGKDASGAPDGKVLYLKEGGEGLPLHCPHVELPVSVHLWVSIVPESTVSYQ